MTIEEICRAWDRPSYVHGDVPSTHALTITESQVQKTSGAVQSPRRSFRKSDFVSRYLAEEVVAGVGGGAHRLVGGLFGSLSDRVRLKR